MLKPPKLNPQAGSIGRLRAPRLFWAVGLMALAAVAGCSGAKVTPEQKAAMSKISDLGGRVDIASGGGFKIDLTRTAVEDKDLENLRHIANLKGVDLQGTRITDAGLEHLAAIESLKFVSLERTAVTREGIDKLKKSLPNTEVSH